MYLGSLQERLGEIASSSSFVPAIVEDSPAAAILPLEAWIRFAMPTPLVIYQFNWGFSMSKAWLKSLFNPSNETRFSVVSSFCAKMQIRSIDVVSSLLSQTSFNRLLHFAVCIPFWNHDTFQQFQVLNHLCLLVLYGLSCLDLIHNLPCVFCHQLLELADGAALVMTTFDGGWGSCGASKIAAKTMVCIHSTRQDPRYLDKYMYVYVYRSTMFIFLSSQCIWITCAFLYGYKFSLSLYR